MRAREHSEAAALLARAFLESPLEVAASRSHPRQRALERWFRHLLATAPCAPLAARRGKRLLGVAGAAPPGGCLLPPGRLLRLLPVLLGFGPRGGARRIAWLARWGAHDPEAPHWHVGPVGVEPALQRRGTGSRLLEALCARFDARATLAWLETDRPENVGFYERFGFTVAEEIEVLGIPTWLMERGRSSISQSLGDAVDDRLRSPRD